MEQQWFKNAITYSLDVETYQDSNGDGIGDFQGLIERLEFIAGLGIDCIWLLPFYPSPNRDNGYDVMDYNNVDPRLGNLEDFSQFMEKAEKLGLRVIIDLVVNHTSKDHPWFQRARKSKDSPFRDYYVWSDEPLKYEREHLMFEGEENTVWTYDEEAKQYYLHRFYNWQPDLNISNERVQEEIFKIISFWLKLGVHGFRIDAAEMLVESYGLKSKEREKFIGFINELRTHAQKERKDVLLLAEVNAGPPEMQEYLQGEERMHMLFNFFVNQHLFLALAQENNTALVKAMKSLPHLSENEQWLNFLRHHDELNLRLLSEKDQELIFRKFAPDEDMRIYKFGIRRRLAPMMNQNFNLLKLSYSLLFSMPGTQMIRYGDEIGMGENLSLQGRTSVRTPMQWSSEENGGFSKAPSNQLVHPVINTGAYSYEKVNILAAQQDPKSLLNWLKELIKMRKNCKEIGFGENFQVPFQNDKVLIHGYEGNRRKIYMIHNLSSEEIEIAIAEVSNQRLYNLFDEEVIEETLQMKLLPFGFYWLGTEKNN